MIVASVLLIIGAAGLLGLGLWQSASGLLSSSIAASLLAAVVLVVGARRAAGARLASGPPDWGEPADWDQSADWTEPGREPPPEPPPPRSEQPPPRSEQPPERATEQLARPTEPVTMTIPTQGAPGRGGLGGYPHGAEADYPPEADYSDEDVDPPDEPPPQQVSAADAARVGRMLTEVLVVDGRPRYHLPGCVHLLGRESEPLPVGEAIELGFTPCSLCEPDSALLADARRV